MSLSDWQFNLMVNLTAPFLLIKAALPHLRATRGAIVNIGSIEGIRCNAVAPRWIDSDLSETYIESMPDPAEFRRNIARIHPAGRTGTPADVAALVAFLASEDSAFITGHTYVVDGGRTVKLPLS